MDLVDAPSWYGEEPDGESDATRVREIMSGRQLDNILDGRLIGGFRPIECIGQGAMGVVFKAQAATGEIVALKILRPELNGRQHAVDRFRKEAMLLDKVESESITRIRKVGEDRGMLFLAMDFVDGFNLRQLIKQRGALPEKFALEIIAQVTRGLANMHDQRIVHRDIKPSNILIRADSLQKRDSSESESLSTNAYCGSLSADSVKLTDFGLARLVDQTRSMELTQTGAILGTPQYMAPEQFSQDAVIDPATDVYSIGATLYEMLSGTPPVVSDSLFQIADKHLHSTPPLLNSINRDLSQAVSQLVAKTLEKNPAHRYADAGQLLDDIDSLLEGVPTSINMHPLLPECDRDNALEYELTCSLDAAPQDLWPYVSNTERINNAVDLPPVHFSTETDSQGTAQTVGTVRFLGMKMRWHEHPFEWVESRKFSVLRQFMRGPIKWIASIVELHPRGDGGTTLVHRFQVSPRGWFGRWFASVQIGFLTRRSFTRVYNRIDSVVQYSNRRQHSSLESASRKSEDPFVSPCSLPVRTKRRIEQKIDRLAKRDIAPDLLFKLSHLIARAPDQLVARIQPIQLARQWGFPENNVITACLHATRVGLLRHQWDLLCPNCKVPSAHVQKLRDVASHGRCQICDIEFRNDLVHNVELTFQTDSSIRKVQNRTYCIGGPWHLPHVVAQGRIAARETYQMDLTLTEGEYRIGSPQLSSFVDLTVDPESSITRHPLRLDKDLGDKPALRISDHGQSFNLSNEFDSELLVRVERRSPPQDILSVSKVASHSVFRELFPDEVPSMESPTLIPQITFVITHRNCERKPPMPDRRINSSGTEIEQHGRMFDPRALDGHDQTQQYANVQSFLGFLRRLIADSGGCFVKAVGDTTVSVFYQSRDAVDAAIKLCKRVPEQEGVRIAIHRGPAVFMSVHDQIEYFGDALETALKMPMQCRDSETMLSQAVVQDADVQALLTSHEIALSAENGFMGAQVREQSKKRTPLADQ